jgi:hypothetical protein
MLPEIYRCYSGLVEIQGLVSNCSQSRLIVPILTVNNSRRLQEVVHPPFLGISGPNILEEYMHYGRETLNLFKRFGVPRVSV